MPEPQVIESPMTSIRRAGAAGGGSSPRPGSKMNPRNSVHP
jgi:hypothetical protein